MFGCDDCQAICPGNKYAQFTAETEGSAIRRIGYEGWLRNLAVGLGNAPSDVRIIEALEAKRDSVSPLIQEHIDWALGQQAKPNYRRKRKIQRKERT